MSDGPALTGWTADVGAEFGGIDILVANGSALSIGQDEASWQVAFETDMMGTVRAVNAAMLCLEASSAAAIVIISSMSGREVDFVAGPGQSGEGYPGADSCSQAARRIRSEIMTGRYDTNPSMN